MKEILAWQTAFERRACPNDKILFKHKESEPLKSHLGYCLFCNERIKLFTERDLETWSEFVRLTHFPLQGSVETVPSPGQIWSIKNSLGGWGPYNRYYNPPQVLLLEKLDHSAGYLVSQIYSDITLMGPGDILLDRELGFAEAWLTYPLHHNYLGHYCGCIDKRLVERIFDKVRDDSDKSQISTTIKSFREIEVEVAGYFSMHSVMQLATDYDQTQEMAPAYVDFYNNIKNTVRDFMQSEIDVLGHMVGINYGFVTRGIDGNKEGIDDIEMDEAIAEALLIPVDNGIWNPPDYEIHFISLHELPETPPLTYVTISNGPHVETKWFSWDDKRAILVINNIDINLEPEDGKPFIRIRWIDGILFLDVLPEC